MFVHDGPVPSKVLNLHSVVNLITETFTGNVHRYMNCSRCLENKGDKILNEVPNDFWTKIRENDLCLRELEKTLKPASSWKMNKISTREGTLFKQSRAESEKHIFRDGEKSMQLEPSLQRG